MEDYKWMLVIGITMDDGLLPITSYMIAFSYNSLLLLLPAPTNVKFKPIMTIIENSNSDIKSNNSKAVM